VARHEDGAALGAERAEQLAHLDDTRGIEAVGRLVEDQQRRIAKQRRGDREPLLHPEGVGLHRILGAVAEPDPLERRVDRGAALAVDQREDLEVPAAAEPREHRRRLDDRADTTDHGR